jgi:glutathione S-transferase
VPVLAPAYTTPAPASQPAVSAFISASTVPSAEEVLATISAAGDAPAAFTAALEARLAYYSYVGGFQPAAADLTASTAVLAAGEEACAALGCNSARWLRSVKSFSAEEMAEWK